jgi:hypothetical protein
MFREKLRVPCETSHTDETDEELRERLANDGIRVQVQSVGKRRAIKHGGKLCSRCLTNPPKPGQRYCGDCLAAANREYRMRVKARHAALCAKLAAYEGHAI